ncbi:corrinoid methyltransferase [Desulfomarina profundi]|uniref:Corrinoid methyltransferase n=1 Tax=Desulfomarina profundi TaxID=2772557 RepID=A0A8D5FHM4_9BACT|nr:corrinoid protein [Desulfomarina profundi]BCL61782.1 corrinoid methyltransferase [Desulfomarina profundi]
MVDLKEITQTLLELDEPKMLQLINKALESGTPADEILNDGLIAGMDIVGQKMENGDMFIPEVLMAAQAMSKGVEVIKHLLADDASSSKGTVVIGTVQGDLHDIGKNLVAMMMESAGLTVHNVGVDVSPDKFIELIKETNANILCLSALLTTTMPMMKQTIDALSESGLRAQVKVMVGGAPVTQEFANVIGADAFAPDAGSAAKRAKELVH